MSAIRGEPDSDKLENDGDVIFTIQQEKVAPTHVIYRIETRRCRCGVVYSFKASVFARRDNSSSLLSALVKANFFASNSR